MKRVICIVLVLILALASSTTAFAGNGKAPKYAGPMDDHGPAYNKSIFDMTQEELYLENQEAFSEQNDETPMRATITINKYAIVTASGNSNVVYASPSTSASQVGYVGNKERIYVYQEWTTQGFYYIQFYNANYVLTTGYIQTSKVYVPPYNYARPIRTGTVTSLFSGGHNGVDVAASSGTSLYASAAGTAAFKTHTYQFPNESAYSYVSYGKFVELTVGSTMFLYGHLSSFVGSSSTPPNLASKQYVSSSSPNYSQYYADKKALIHQTLRVLPYGTAQKNQDSLVGYVGSSGNSTGNHLHFEVRISGVAKDPYNYVIFPGVGW